MNDFNRSLAGWDLSAAASAMIAAKLSPEMSVAIDVWIEQQPDPKPSRSEVVRRALTMLLANTKSSGSKHVEHLGANVIATRPVSSSRKSERADT